MSLTLELEPSVERQLREQAARQGLEPNSYAVAAIEEKLRVDARLEGCAGVDQTELLSQIGAGLPETTWDRYDALNRKRRSEMLTPSEHAELMQLINQIEQDHARRTELALKLSRLRSISLESLLLQLRIDSRRSNNADSASPPSPAEV